MRKKKEESIENFLNKLIRAKGCFDVAEMESYIKRTTSYDRDLLDRQIERVEKLLDTRYGHSPIHERYLYIRWNMITFAV